MKPEKAGCVAKQGPRLEIIFSWKYLAWKISVDVFEKLNYVAIMTELKNMKTILTGRNGGQLNE